MYEAIKTEIERYIAHYEKIDRNDFNNGELYICQELISFIKSLEKEQDVDLEKEIIRYKVPFSDDREYLNETTLDSIARHFYEFGLNAKENAPKIKGWVARDKGAKSCCFYFNKPIRHTISWMDERGETGVYDDDYVFLSDLHLDIEDLKWEDEPIEVELTIHRV